MAVCDLTVEYGTVIQLAAVYDGQELLHNLCTGSTHSQYNIVLHSKYKNVPKLFLQYLLQKLIIFM